MIYEYDEAKAFINLAKHGVSFELIKRFEWRTATVEQDTRKDYGEDRFIAFGKIDGRVHVVVYTTRSGIIRLIGLRKANSREVKRYESQA
ncbi:MAG TPA: BrnT family toxin [Gammaproteobacteria bacterium]|jgi:uncharacterized DUF497 family protein|nr:BrnT family toxin [Gammaproteobacteria bacterium]